MQILHPFASSIQQYCEAISHPDRYRPDHCPQCEAKHPLTGHGFYCRTLADVAFDGVIRVRRYLCRLMQAHGLFAAGLCVAVAALKPNRNLTVSGGPPAPRLNFIKYCNTG